MLVVPDVSKAGSTLNIENEETSGSSIPKTKPCNPKNLKPELRRCLEIERNIREQQNERMKNGHKRLNRKESERKKRRKEEMKEERKKERIRRKEKRSEMKSGKEEL